MIKMIMAHLVVKADFLEKNLIESLDKFLYYIFQTQLNERLYLEDYYFRTEIPYLDDPIQIFDPVKTMNNGSFTHSVAQKAFNQKQLMHNQMYPTRQQN